MLQQTQVATVIPYWHRWMEQFPTVESLAAADEQAVLALWQGLGYYRRCRLLLQGAQWVAEHGMPNTAAELLKVPGIGPYTAGAIASIAFNQPTPLVDGNVERVFARLMGDTGVGQELHDSAWVWAKRNLYKKRPGDWNQALMELGATVCRPVAPDCKGCPVADKCVAFQSWRVDELPRKAAKVTTVKLQHVVWVPMLGDKFGVKQIPAGQWWEGMWEFPRVDADGTLEPIQLREMVGQGWKQDVGTVKHSVTHHRITIEVSFVQCDEAAPNLRWVSRQEILEIPMPAPQRKALKLVFSHLGL